ncbi:MAG: flagellar biosynthesis protein FlhA [Armatimonadetes bacterium]|nr:flagellar biosynthesis protein FlhA [Armatimonadota bacterium]MCX7969557.1 flagellar biosynthesis protein FlhA [Armatimonadota bacterium]MDW8143939.1 flagellar biosynthesis protein FlhA [Armatimonadota bacterium]
MASVQKSLGLKQTEVWTIVAVALVLAMLLVPMPPILLDMMLALHFVAALTLFFAVLLLRDALEMSSFPSLLLFSALFRTALSIAVMRAILTTGNAGQFVKATGEFVLGGNFLVGVVLFLTLFIVQFAVVTGGANRIAEVAARFTLDALPGKQMSIDADLSAGLITEEEARQRRKRLELEADFYGAMDGAAKFVRGDAITALLVAILCFIGGLLVGVWQRGESWETALRTYALLTVGQGLLIQIPALLVSAASGFIVTRAASEESLSSTIVKETKSQPDALLVAAGVSALLGLVPGLPKLPFLALSAALGIGAWFLRQQALVQQQKPKQPAQPVQPQDFTSYVRIDPVELELGFALVPMAMEQEGGKLLQRITNLRRKLAEDLGLLVPPIRVRDNLLLPPNRYVVKVRGARVSEADCYPHKLLAVGGPHLPPLDGIATKDPAFGLPAFWIEPDKKREAERFGYTVVDAETALITHISEIVKTYAPDIMSRQEVQALIDQVRLSHPAVVEEVTPQLLSRSEIHQVLCNLLAEGVPIKDMVAILEALADAARVRKDLDYLTERVRRRLARLVCQPYLTPDGALAAIVLDPEIEKRLSDSVQETDIGWMLVPEPTLWQRLLEQIAQAAERIAAEGLQPVIVCGSGIRLPFRRLLARFLPRIPVLSYEEVNTAKVNLQAKAIVGGEWK